MSTTTRSIVSDGLDMFQYPVGTLASHPPGDHIMGVVALAWCTDDAIDRWGESWARHGSVEMRFRSHLTTGLDLSIDARHGSDETVLDVTDPDGTLFASGTLRPGPSAPLASTGRPAAEPFPVPPHAELLDGYELHPIECDFVAARDLHLTERLAHGEFWRTRNWAHPAWIASAANAIVRHNVDFEDGGYWMHAGVRVDLHRPVLDGAHLLAQGRVVELFERSVHRFMVCEVLVTVDDVPAASIRSTSVYGAASVSP